MRKFPVDFIIIGAMKCGTTTLYRQLAEHPDVSMSRHKETDFFVEQKNWSLGLDWYENQFEPGDKVRGEASPNYTKKRDFPGVPARVHSLAPNVKLIYIVRDPVRRAESQFRHSFLMGALGPDIDVLASSDEYEHILDASLYGEQLSEFGRYFPWNSMKVIDFDEMVARPQKIFDQVCDFIGVNRIALSIEGAHNDSSQLSRVPAPILRFSQTRFGQDLAGMMSRDRRDQIRSLLAFGKQRTADSFTPELKEKFKRDLSRDVDRFRQLTGNPFENWSV